MVQHVSIRLKDRNTVEVVVDGNKIDGVSYYKVEESVDQPTEVTLRMPVISVEVQMLLRRRNDKCR